MSDAVSVDARLIILQCSELSAMVIIDLFVNS